MTDDRRSFKRVAQKCAPGWRRNWNPDYGLVEWRRKLAETGWGAPHWPTRGTAATFRSA